MYGRSHNRREKDETKAKGNRMYKQCSEKKKKKKKKDNKSSQVGGTR